MAKKGEGVLGVAVVFLLVVVLLPTIGAVVGGALDEVTAVLLGIAPKVAVVAGIAALIMFCIPFTRHHAQGMLVGAVVLAVGAAAFSTIVAWLGAHSAVLTADVLSAGNTLLAHLNA